jgi:dUTP pyrophosphatase
MSKESLFPNPDPRYNPFDPFPTGEYGKSEDEGLGIPITRKEAIDIAHKILEEAERQRKETIEREAMSFSTDFHEDNISQSAIVNPKHILDLGAVKPYEGRPSIIIDPKDDECALQQNGIDLRLDEVQVADGATIFTLHKKGDIRCKYHKLEPDAEGMFGMYPGHQYALDCFEEVNVPKGMAAYIFVRSSINRYAGIFLCALWDSGFRGRLGGIFRPYIPTFIERGCRIAQIVFFTADSYRQYEGQYQDQKGQV